MNIPARLNDLATQLREEIAEMGGDDFATLMKFDANTATYTVDRDEVPLGREYVAHVPQYARGWTKFIDKQRVARKIFKLVDGIPPERNELDERDKAGRDDDPWVFQRYQPLEDLETGELVVFASKSVGGKIALSKLLQAYANNRHRGLPIVKLEISTFTTQNFGDRKRPDFKIVGWRSDRGPDMEIPGPPDEGDPGYDEDNLSR